MVFDNMKDYSQYGEQPVILDYLQKQGIEQGRFLDIGANDGINYSNSYALVLKDWKGVAVEASPANFVKLKENYKDFPIDLVCACVGVTPPEIIKFYNAEDGTISTPNLENKKIWEDRTHYTDIYLPLVTPGMIIHKFGRNFDFVSIDIEGGSFDLFKHIIADLWKTGLICLEHDGKATEALQIAIQFDFHEIHRNGTNIILAK